MSNEEVRHAVLVVVDELAVYGMQVELNTTFSGSVNEQVEGKYLRGSIIARALESCHHCVSSMMQV